MALSASAQPGQINVTPLIDVLLVLIIIFMVITPVSPQGLNTSVPQKSDNDTSAPLPSTLVLSIASDLSLTLNQQPLTSADLPARLRTIMASRAQPVLFIAGSRDLEFHTVAEVIDLARGVGLERIALLP